MSCDSPGSGRPRNSRDSPRSGRPRKPRDSPGSGRPRNSRAISESDRPRNSRDSPGSGRPRNSRATPGSGRPRKLRVEALEPLLASGSCWAFIPFRSRSVGSTVFALIIFRLPLFTSDVNVDIFLLISFGQTGTWKSPDTSSTHNTTLRPYLIQYRILYIYVFRLKRQCTE